MRKEVVIAILIGSLLGLAVAFGVWRANQVLTPENADSPKGRPAVKESQDNTTSPQLIITQPEDGLVVAEDKVLIKGAAQVGATLVILTNTGETIFPVASDGGFEHEVDLEGGANEITIISYNEQGEEKRETVTVVYSTEFPEE